MNNVQFVKDVEPILGNLTLWPWFYRPPRQQSINVKTINFDQSIFFLFADVTGFPNQSKGSLIAGIIAI